MDDKPSGWTCNVWGLFFGLALLGMAGGAIGALYLLLRFVATLGG